MEESVHTKSKWQRKDLFCWHCLRWIRWTPNPHQIRTLRELLQKSALERRMIMPTYGINPREIGPNLYTRIREMGAHRLNPWAYYPSLMNLMDGAIIWKEQDGEYVPHCYFCDKLLRDQRKWRFIKGWIKYPLTIVLIGLSLWLLMKLLGRSVLLIDM